MAARRISKSTVDWAAMASRVPESQKNSFQAFKAKSDGYLRRVLSNPETAPAVDWAYYKKNISLPGLVDEFQKKYDALKVPYPQENLTPQIEAQEKQAVVSTEVFIKESNERIAEFRKELEKWDAMIPFDQMTMEELVDHFPECLPDPNNSTIWPHEREEEDAAALAK